MYDPDANYIYGIISRQMGDLADAKETLEWAARSPMYRSAANCALGGISVTEGNWELAEEYLHRSLDYDAYNLRTYQILATTYRLAKQPEKAREHFAEDPGTRSPEPLGPVRRVFTGSPAGHARCISNP